MVDTFQVMQTAHRIYYVLEYCSGGDLFHYVQAKGPLGDSPQTQSLFVQMLRGILSST